MMVVSGMKKRATPMPRINWGRATEKKSMPGVEPARQKKQPAKTRKLRQAIRRMSRRRACLPRMGEMISGNTPTGAREKPAHMAV